MLSGVERTPMPSGIPMTKNKLPARIAPQRQPQVCTAIANSGVINVPPMGTAELITVIARARQRMNQELPTAIGAWTKPGVNESEIKPR